MVNKSMGSDTAHSEIATVDGNEAAARIAYKTNELCVIYPITPASPMAELADQWATEGRPNIWGNIPTVIEMQSEGGASGTVHGALQAGALTTTFTASQGLLLMIPNMYKIAGELTATVFHVASRSLACQALSIFADHSDVMATRSTGFAQLCSSSVQEAHDMALIAQAATLESRIPFIHFFDGFRTSHEINKICLLNDSQIKAMIRAHEVLAHRHRGLNPDHPFIRGTAQNPDVYFQARESVNPFYGAAAEIVQHKMDAFAKIVGRQYNLFDYYGDPQADRVVIIMGSGSETVRETTEYLREKDEKIGVLQVHLYRPFSGRRFLQSLPKDCQAIAVLDRTKEPGATGEPLYQDVVTTLVEAQADGSLPMDKIPRIIGGRYGLSSKEFTPAMVKCIFDELRQQIPRNHFTVGINDDVMRSSLEYDQRFTIESDSVYRAMFYGRGADGTVSANKNSIKIIGMDTKTFAQGYFVYDSKKSGSRTVSHLRFGSAPIRSTYLIQSANFIGCHQFAFVEKIDILKCASNKAIFLLNCSFGPEEVWGKLPVNVQEKIVEKKLKFYVIDASKIAREFGLGERINTIMQTCFFAISGVLPKNEAIAKIKRSIRTTYGRKGDDVVQKNLDSVDHTLTQLSKVSVPVKAISFQDVSSTVPNSAPEFVREVTTMMMNGRGDELPVSALPVDGTYPTGTAAWEKRNISKFVPLWEPEICIQCGNCSFVCPHSVIRSKFYDQSRLRNAPEHFKSTSLSGRGYPDQRYTLQVYVEDCTGCALCVEVCPAKSKEKVGKKAINMRIKDSMLNSERENIRFFESIPEYDREQIDFSSVRGVQYLQPLFEFSGACAGCGETPYIKLLTQLFGDRLVIANATGCSSIYGGNLPTTPWTVDKHGRGPAWSNSLFEDNAEFGFGFRLAFDKQRKRAESLLIEMKDVLGAELVETIVSASQKTDGEISKQRERLALVKERLKRIKHENIDELPLLIEHLVRRSVWVVGGDGWAYDIGYSGLDHVIASGRDVNVLILDTEVYSNTGGQASKATPLAAVAKFATAGKKVGKKDLALMAIAYGNVYVARVAMGANPQQTLLAFREAEAYKGPSLILAYSHCIAHGINMQRGLRQQKLAVDSSYWPLLRYNPELKKSGENPMQLDSQQAKISLEDYAYNEMRYKVLSYTNPEEAQRLLALAQLSINEKWNVYEQLAVRGSP